MELLLHPFAATTVLVAGLMAGSELAVALFFHSVLYRLPDAAHTQAAKKLAGVLGTVMPFWYAASLLLCAVLAWSVRGSGSLPLDLAAGAAGLLLLPLFSRWHILCPSTTGLRRGIWTPCPLAGNVTGKRGTGDTLAGLLC